MKSALTPSEHQHSAVVEQAAMWLAEQPIGSAKPTVPTLRARFDLTAPEACEAIAWAARMRMLRSAHG